MRVSVRRYYLVFAITGEVSGDREGVRGKGKEKRSEERKGKERKRKERKKEEKRGEEKEFNRTEGFVNIIL